MRRSFFTIGNYIQVKLQAEFFKVSGAELLFFEFFLFLFMLMLRCIVFANCFHSPATAGKIDHRICVVSLTNLFNILRLSLRVYIDTLFEYVVPWTEKYFIPPTLVFKAMTVSLENCLDAFDLFSIIRVRISQYFFEPTLELVKTIKFFLWLALHSPVGEVVQVSIRCSCDYAAIKCNPALESSEVGHLLPVLFQNLDDLGVFSVFKGEDVRFSDSGRVACVGDGPRVAVCVEHFVNLLRMIIRFQLLFLFNLC